MGNDEQHAYTAADIQVLQFPEAVRARPGMYFGDTRLLVEHAVRELVANSIDQVLVGRASTVDVELQDHHVRVSDDGEGLPFDLYTAEEMVRVFTAAHVGATRDGHAPHVHLTLHGVGLACLNAVAKSFRVSSWRNGKRYELQFEDGVHVPGQLITDEGEGRGTVFAWAPDTELFTDLVTRPAVVRADLLRAAHLFSPLSVRFEGESFHAARGLLDLAWLLAEGESPSRTHSDLHIVGEDDGVRYEVALVGHGGNELVRAWSNGVLNRDGGSHVDGLADALFDHPGYEVKLVHVVMTEPRYAGPTRGKLDVPKVHDVIRNAVAQRLGETGA